MKTCNEPMQESSAPDTYLRGLRRGERLTATQDYRKAAETYQQIIDRLPGEVHEESLQFVWEQAHVGLVRCYHALGSPGEAIPVLRKAIRQHPDSESLRCMLAMSYGESGQLVKATRTLLQGMGRGCDGPLVHQCLAEIYLRQGKLDDAIAECRRSLDRDTSQESVYEILADALVLKSEHESAIAVLQAATACNPDNTGHYLRMASIYRNQDKLSQAVSLLKEACDKNPRSLDLREMLIECLCESNHVDQIVQETRAALRLSPKNLQLLDVLAFAYLQKGDTHSAATEIQRALRIAPLDSINRFKLAALYHQQGELRRAQQEYEVLLDTATEGPLLQQANEALLSIDQAQLQQIVMLSTENAVFRIKLQRNVDNALSEYEFRLSDQAIGTLRSMVMEGLLDGALPLQSSTVH